MNTRKSLGKQLTPYLLAFVVILAVYLAGWVGSLGVGCTPAAEPSDLSNPAAVSKAPSPQSQSGSINLSSLPKEANDTLKLIKGGGPFPFAKDGAVFSNYEGFLPAKQTGYYHEYTVITPGSSDRGARRIIAGSPREYYYTGDHYRSFKRIVD